MVLKLATIFDQFMFNLLYWKSRHYIILKSWINFGLITNYDPKMVETCKISDFLAVLAGEKLSSVLEL